MPSARADVADLPDNILRQLVLNVEVVILDHRRLKIAVNRKHIRIYVVREDRNIILNLRHSGIREKDRRGTHRIVRRARIERIERQLTDKEVLRKCVVKQPPAAADHCFAFTTDVPCKTEPRAEIVPVGSVQLIEAIRSNLNKTALQIKMTQQIILFADHAKIVPTNAEIQRQFVTRAPIVLKIKRMRSLESLPL